MVLKPDKLDSGGRLVNGDPKPGKKMKKRRELDALVGKTRRKNRGGHELLRNDSESSEIEEFSSADSKITVRNRRGGSACGTCLTVLAFLLLLACIIACAGLIWVHLELKTELDRLRGRVQSVESSNDGIPSEWQDLKSHVEEWRISLDALKIKAASNLTALSEQVTQLKADLKNIKQQLEKNSEGGSRDDQGLAKSVATIGSDVESLKEKTTALEISTSKKFTTEDERLTQLESKVSLLVVSPAQPSPSPSVNSAHQPISVPSVLTELRASIQTMNGSLSDRIEGLSQQIGQQQNRLEAVELAKRPVTINTTVITQSIRRELLSYVKELVSNASDSPASLPPGYVTPDTSFLDMIKQQVENITQVVSSLEKQITQDVPKTQNSTKGRTEMALQYLLHQFNVTESSLKSLNETVSRMGRESDRMMQLYVNEKNIVTRLSHEMNAVRQYLDKLPGPHDFPDDMFTSDNSTDVPDETLSTTTETPNSSTTNREKRDLAWNKELEDLFAN